MRGNGLAETQEKGRGNETFMDACYERRLTCFNGPRLSLSLRLLPQSLALQALPRCFFYLSRILRGYLNRRSDETGF
jgi:hypothetical protein